jgi:hypothetical protein
MTGMGSGRRIPRVIAGIGMMQVHRFIRVTGREKGSLRGRGRGRGRGIGMVQQHRPIGMMTGRRLQHRVGRKPLDTIEEVPIITKRL